MTEPRVSLDTAWRWVCPACGTVNFVSSTIIEEDEATAIMREDMGIPDDVELVTQPERVVCNKCRKIHLTEVPE